MSIWFREVSLSHANSRGANSLIGHLGIELIEAGDDNTLSLIGELFTDIHEICFEELPFIHPYNLCILT